MRPPAMQRARAPPPCCTPRHQPEKTLFSIIQAAGWPIWPLILCSVVALALVIERLFHLRENLVAPPTCWMK
jgi:biopolymer transport protein ExbB/TolQ